MSQKIKARKKKEKKIKLYSNLIIALIIILFISLFSLYIYNKFFAAKKIESFFPEESYSFFLIRSNFTSDQGDKLRKLGLRFGDEKYFQNFLEDLIFPKLRDQKLDIPEEKFIGWRGDYVAVGNIKLSNIENIPIFVLEAKNPSLAGEFLKILEENLNKRGYVITSEDFRGHKVTSNRGLSEISYAVFDNYLLVSEKSDGVKKMIDTALGRFTSIYEEENYKTVKKKLSEDESIVFSYFDPLELARSIPFLNTSAIEPIERVGLRNRSNLRMGMSFIPNEYSIEAKLYSNKNYDSKDKKLKSKLSFAKKIPQDVLLYFEDNNLQSLIENFLLNSDGDDPEVEIAAMKKLAEMETGIDLDKDLFEHLSENYTLYMLPSSNKEQLDIVSIFEVENEDKFAENLNKIENSTLELLKKTKKGEEIEGRKFTDHNYQNINYRYLNLPDEWNIDLAYALIDDYFYITTSDVASQSAIDVILGRVPEKLADNKIFKDSYNLARNDDSDQFFYANLQSFIQFMNYHLDFEYENLDRKVKILESLSFVKEEKRKDNFYNLFLRVK